MKRTYLLIFVLACCGCSKKTDTAELAVFNRPYFVAEVNHRDVNFTEWLGDADRPVTNYVVRTSSNGEQILSDQLVLQAATQDQSYMLSIEIQNFQLWEAELPYTIALDKDITYDLEDPCLSMQYLHITELGQEQYLRDCYRVTVTIESWTDDGWVSGQFSGYPVMRVDDDCWGVIVNGSFNIPVKRINLLD